MNPNSIWWIRLKVYANNLATNLESKKIIMEFASMVWCNLIYKLNWFIINYLCLTYKYKWLISKIIVCLIKWFFINIIKIKF